jgi:hypothetical protein
VWYLDLGNAAASGQLYHGNALRAEQLRGAFDSETHTCRALPAPSVQAPELLEASAAPLPVSDQDCAEAQVAGDREPFVNRAIAALGLAMVARLCQRTLTWRATFFDLEVGALSYTHADPRDVARLMGVRTRRRAAAPPPAARLVLHASAPPGRDPLGAAAVGSSLALAPERQRLPRPLRG